MKRLDEQNVFMIASCDIMNSIYRNMPTPPVHKPSIPQLQLPFAKFHDADSFLDAYMRNNNKAMRALCLASIATDLSHNESELLKIIKVAPEAICKMPTEYMDMAFIVDALERNPLVYSYLPENLQKDRSIIDVYARSFWKNGVEMADITLDSWDPERKQVNPQEALPMYKYAVDQNCDLSQFYSARNYGKAYEQMIQSGAIHMEMRMNSKGEFYFNAYAPQVAYLHMANLVCPEQRSDYMFEEFKAISKNIHVLANIVRQNPQSLQANIIAEAAARAEEYFRRHPFKDNIRGQKEHWAGTGLIETIADAEKEYYKAKGQELRNRLEQFESERFHETINIRTASAENIDTLMEIAACHPDMGITSDEIQNWWEQRGEDYVFEKNHEEDWLAQYNNKMAHLDRMLEAHPEMQVGIDRAEQELSSQKIEHE